MNAFQKQLKMSGGRTLAEIDGRLIESGVGPSGQPRLVSAEDFLRDMEQVRSKPMTPPEPPAPSAEPCLCERCGKEPASGIQPRGRVGLNPLCISCRNADMTERMARRRAMKEKHDA